MATRSTPRITTKNSKNITSPKSQKTVFLQVWWLIKAENNFNGKRLAVAGLTFKSRRKTATQIFSSAPILKRCNTNHLETADKITVFIHGNINKTRTHENGISFEVCTHFLNGFPYNWEDFSYHCGEGSISTNVFGRLNACGNLKGGESEWSSSEEKSEDAAEDAFLQTNSEDSVGQKSDHDNKIAISQTKTKRRLEYTTDVSSIPITKDRKKNLLSLPPEESNCKRSRSGRVIVPQLDYWRNQQVLYDKDHGIVGISNGLPVEEYHTEGKSKPSRKKKSMSDLVISSTPITKDRKKNLFPLPLEEFNCKRSRSGRVIVPPLDYWRNHHVLYDKDRGVVGILNGLPVEEHRTGSKSKPLRKKKFV